MILYITEELGRELKNIRKENKVKSRDISLHIGKSPTYISKLESGSIKKIDDDELINIFAFIFKDKGDFWSRFQEFIGKCMYKMTDEDIKRKIWVNNFDTVISKIPIPPELVDYCVEKMSEINKSIAEITERINKNEDLGDIDNPPHKDQEKNSWYATDDSLSIQMDVSPEIYEEIFSKQTVVSNHVNIFAFVYNMFKYISPTYEEAGNNAHQILKKYKFLSVQVKNELLRESNTDEEVGEILTDFDKINNKLIDRINSFFKAISDFNISYSNEKLQILLNNFEQDRMITIAYLGIDLRKLNHLKIEDKKAFMEDIKSLVEQYSEKPKNEFSELI